MNTPKTLRHLGPITNIDHVEMADIISLFAAKCTSAEWCKLQLTFPLQEFRAALGSMQIATRLGIEEIPVERCGSCHRPIKPDEITHRSPMWGTLCELCLDKV